MMQRPKEEELYYAALHGELEKAKRLCSDPAVNVNHAQEGITPLYAACQKGRFPVVAYLLQRPGIEVNKPTPQSSTPFSVACQRGHRDVVRLMTEDLRVDLNKPKDDESTPLWFAACNGHKDVVQLILLCERYVDTKSKSKFNQKAPADAARWAASQQKWDKVPGDDINRRKENCPFIAKLIDDYEQDPTGTRALLKKELGLPGNVVYPFFPPQLFSGLTLYLFFLVTDSTPIKLTVPVPEEEQTPEATALSGDTSLLKKRGRNGEQEETRGTEENGPEKKKGRIMKPGNPKAPDLPAPTILDKNSFLERLESIKASSTGTCLFYFEIESEILIFLFSFCFLVDQLWPF